MVMALHMIEFPVLTAHPMRALRTLHDSFTNPEWSRRWSGQNRSCCPGCVSAHVSVAVAIATPQRRRHRHPDGYAARGSLRLPKEARWIAFR